ncbi:hypothetical protein TL16_g10292 [Triparma laevis f. inornata]|uniref:Tetratricopeptide repeat protein n=1 Tax=Triparma laevis f. inornata TaxID=1714386 RepID=A0A9W7BF76_9STRA|nr:hypothetical protein TL16_g10292 [Triparma laevis f. inornata]
MKQGDPCPFCRKQIEGYELGKWSSSPGAAELWPTSLRNLSELASGEGFNDYFRDSFNGNEATWKRWKEVFDVLGVGEKGGVGSIEAQVLGITNSEDLVKPRALAVLCSKDFFNDESLSVVAWRRIMEVMEMEKEVVGEKDKEDHKHTLMALHNLGALYDDMENYEKTLEYYERALKGYERVVGTNQPSTLLAVMNIAIVYEFQKDYGKAEELYQRALEG